MILQRPAGAVSFLAGLLTLVAPTAAAAVAPELIVRDPARPVVAPAHAGEAAAREVVTVNAAALADAPEVLWLEPAPGEGRWAYRTGIEHGPADELVWRGRFAEDEPDFASVTLTRSGGTVIGTFHLPGGGTYLLRPRAAGASELWREDPALFECGVGAGEEVSAEPPFAPAHPDAEPAPLPEPVLAHGEGATADREVYILVLYSPLAAAKLGGGQQVSAMARHNVDLLNTALVNSGVDGRAYLAAAVEADLEFDVQNGGEALGHAIGHPLARQLQDHWRADVVSVVVQTSDEVPSVCGYANVMFRSMVGPQMRDRAYNIIGEGCFHGSSGVFTHETGHVFGAQHDPERASSPQQAAFPFSFAHGVDGAFRTVMAYGTACNDCSLRNDVFSNPERTIDGIPTGVPDQRDNARTLSMTFPIVSAFRSGTPPPPPPAPTPPPAAPSDLTAAAASPTEIALAWTDNAVDETGYRVEGRIGDGTGSAGWQLVAELPPNAVAHTAGGLEPDTAYRFRVRAVRGGRESGYSNEATAITPPALPAAPADLSAEPLSTGAVTLSWSAADRAAGYEVELRTADPAGDRGPQPIVLDPGGAAFDGLEPATPYTFRVRALNDTGASAWSAPASATTLGFGGPCPSDGSALCLLDGRFEARARWRNPRPPFGHGAAGAQSAPASQRSGLFTFFNPLNVELAVKMLDARPVTGSFWLFYGALSDVEYWISVRDTANGGLRTYHNAPFELCGRGDTAAFVEEPDVPADGTSRAAPLGPVRLAQPVVPVPSAPASAAAAGTEGGECQPGPQAACLAGGRFRAEVTWENPRGAGGSGSGGVFDGAGNDLSAYFWFFRPDNLELAVKILDGRSINGHYWIFWGGLSDVGYTIRITDTETGEQHDFENPPLTLCGGAVTDRL